VLDVTAQGIKRRNFRSCVQSMLWFKWHSRGWVENGHGCSPDRKVYSLLKEDLTMGQRLMLSVMLGYVCCKAPGAGWNRQCVADSWLWTTKEMV